MSKVDEKTQDEVAKIIGEIAQKVKLISTLFDGASSQDKAMFGAVVFGMYNPWTDTEANQFVGTQALVPAVINKIVATFRKGPQTKQLPKMDFGPGPDKRVLN